MKSILPKQKELNLTLIFRGIECCSKSNQNSYLRKLRLVFHSSEPEEGLCQDSSPGMLGEKALTQPLCYAVLVTPKHSIDNWLHQAVKLSEVRHKKRKIRNCVCEFYGNETEWKRQNLRQKLRQKITAKLETKRFCVSRLFWNNFLRNFSKSTVADNDSLFLLTTMMTTTLTTSKKDSGCFDRRRPLSTNIRRIKVSYSKNWEIKISSFFFI